ncbi:MAG: hypothetical protein WKH64_09765 [Chloroflexia bacterium]
METRNDIKSVSVEHLEHALARALSDLIGRQYIVRIHDVEYKSEGAWIQFDAGPDLSSAMMKSLFENLSAADSGEK